MASIKVTQKRNNSTEISFAGGLTIYSVMEAYHQIKKGIQNMMQVGLDFGALLVGF